MTYEDFKDRVEEKMEKLAKEYNIEYFTVNPDYHDDFSWDSCPICCRDLGGERFKLLGVRKNLEIIEFEVCTDCMLYNEFGCVEDFNEL